MRTLKKGVLLLQVLSVFVSTALYSQNDSIRVALKLEKKGGLAREGYYNSVVMQIILVSNSKKVLKVPTRAYFTVRESNMPSADCYFEVKTKGAAGKDSILPATNDCDPISIRRSEKIPRLMLLHKGKSVTYTNDLVCPYLLLPNCAYSVRVCFRLSKNNFFPDKFSEWTTIKL